MTEDVSKDIKARVISIVKAFHPNAKIIAFGSRVKGTAKKYSDLDIVIDDGRQLTIHELGVLSENFAATDIPYKIDIVDWHSLDEPFQEIIRKSCVRWD